MKKTSLLDNITFGDTKPVIAVLFETETSKEIRIIFKNKQFMKEHKTSFPITVEIFDGAIDFGVNNTTFHLEKGDLVSLEPNIPHDLVAREDSIVRLTLSKFDTVERVIEVTKS